VLIQSTGREMWKSRQKITSQIYQPGERRLR
jgi:hypothetical protein